MKNMQQLDLFSGQVSEEKPKYPYNLYFDTPEDLERVLEKLSVVEVGLFYLGDKVQKRPVSHKYKGLCPFHTEKTPSFYLEPKRNRFICYGCKEEGGPLLLDHLLGEKGYHSIARRAGVEDILPSIYSHLVIPPESTTSQREFLEVIQKALAREKYYL